MATRPKSRFQQCCHYCRLACTFLFSHVGLCTLVMAYATLGAFLFEYLESNNARKIRAKVTPIKENLILHLWNITESPDILIAEYWKKEASVYLKVFTTKLVELVKDYGYDGYSEDTIATRWDFIGSFFYSIIVMTTIGYGDVAPKTLPGKLGTIFYAVIGIPLMLIFLSNIGDFLANIFRFLYWKICCKYCFKQPSRKSHRKKHRRNKEFPQGSLGTTPIVNVSRYVDHRSVNQVPIISNKYVIHGNDQEHIGNEPSLQYTRQNSDFDSNSSDESEENEPNIPVIVCLCILICYLCGGGLLFRELEEGWLFIDAFYFCFITLCTIGFGDYVPSTNYDNNSNDKLASLISCAFYLLFGMVLVTMSFNLIKESVANSVKCIAKKIGLIAKDKDSDEL